MTRGSRGGQALVELALTLPLFVLLISALVFFMRAWTARLAFQSLLHRALIQAGEREDASISTRQLLKGEADQLIRKRPFLALKTIQVSDGFMGMRNVRMEFGLPAPFWLVRRADQGRVSLFVEGETMTGSRPGGRLW